MNLNEYQRLALRTSGTGHDRVKNGCLGLIGESGEIVDIVKKYMFQSGENPPFPKDKFIKEMGDVLWYCAETVSGMELELNTVLAESHLYMMAGNTDLEFASTVLTMQASCAYNAYFCYHDAEDMLDSIRVIYCALLRLCVLIGTTIDEVADTNIEKLKKRYPDGFDPERSIHRPEYEHAEKPTNIGGSAPTFLFEARNKTI